MFCIKCGQQLPDDANFCAACGNKVFRSTPLSPTISNVEYDSVANKAEDIIINDEMQSLNVHYAGDVVREKAEFIGESNTYSNDDYNVSDRITPSSIAVNRGKYTKIEPYSEGLAAVERGGKWGFIDENGKEIIPIIYDSVQKAFDDSRIIWADRNGKMGFIDINGSVVFPFKYDLIFPMDYKRISVYNEQVGLHYDGRGIMARLNRKFGFVDITGEEIIPLKYDRVLFFRGGYAPVKLNDKWGIINKKGEEVTPIKYDDIDFINDNPKFAKTTFNGKYGFIKYDGTEIIPSEYDEISDFKSNIALIKKNGKCGYLMYNEDKFLIKIDCILDAATEFDSKIYDEPIAMIIYNGSNYFIDKKFYVYKRKNWAFDGIAVLTLSFATLIAMIIGSFFDYIINPCPISELMNRPIEDPIVIAIFIITFISSYAILNIRCKRLIRIKSGNLLKQIIKQN